MKRRISLVRCLAAIIAAVAVSALSGCGSKSESSGGRSTNSELSGDSSTNFEQSESDSTSSDSQGILSILGGRFESDLFTA